MAAKIDQAYRAGVIWGVVTKRAATVEPFITYSELASLLGTVPIAVRYALDPIQRYCIDEGLPPLTMLVVSKNTGRQGTGYVGRRTDVALHEVLTHPWGTLQNPFSDLREDEIRVMVDDLLNDPDAAPDRYVLTLTRGDQQRVFRRAVMEAYGHRCCICGISYNEVLEAAHILPWKASQPGLRIDPRNGLAMCANHHRLYDSGILSVDGEFRIHYEDEDDPADLSEADNHVALRHHGNKILLPAEKKLWPARSLLRERNV